MRTVDTKVSTELGKRCCIMNWILRGCPVNEEAVKRLAVETGLPLPLAQVLAVRGLTDASAAKEWLAASKGSFFQPSLMKDMDRGTDLILKAVEAGDKIAVYGDYDVDGITSTTILYKTLTALGADPIYYIPQRETEGYGLNSNAIQEFANQGVKLLLTCDNGIAAREQVAFARELGLTVVLTDHHEVPFETDAEGTMVYIMPDAHAIINPKRPDCPYPFKQLCAGFIAYKIAQYIYARTGLDWQVDGAEYLQMAAIATICDIMDLTGENRTLIANALPTFKNCHNPGIRSLIAATGLAEKEIDVYHIGFILGPCINASGRLDMAETAVELLLTKDEAEAQVLAAKLVELNTARKHMTAKGVEIALADIEEKELQEDKVLVVYDSRLPESVGGIVAGRVKELFHRPVFVLSGEKEPVRGSGRSIPGYNMFESLQQCQQLLLAFGGHPMAAGLSVPADNIEALRQFLNTNCDMTFEEMVPQTLIDLQLPLEWLSLDLARAQSRLEPFGKGNAIPLFADKEVNLRQLQLFGPTEQVVRLTFQLAKDKGTLQTILFRQRNRFEEMIKEYGGDFLWQELLSGSCPGVLIDILYHISVNHFNNREQLQVQIQDFRISK